MLKKGYSESAFSFVDQRQGLPLRRLCCNMFDTTPHYLLKKYPKRQPFRKIEIAILLFELSTSTRNFNKYTDGILRETREIPNSN